MVPTVRPETYPAGSLTDPMQDIKGRIAESLVEQLFRALGWRVLRFGMEHTHPHLFEAVKGRSDPVSTNVRSQPDFIVHRDGGQPYFVEVKYRKSGNLTREHIGANYPYPTAFVVFVSPYRIQCVTAGDLNNGVELRRENSEYLFADRKEFGADRHIVYQFVELAEKLFAFDRT